MQESECKPITKEFVEQFLLEAQSHSGFPITNDEILKYISLLEVIDISDNLLESSMNRLINEYMKDVHKAYRITKTWKSYDW